MTSHPVTLAIDATLSVSALICEPPRAKVGFVLAHGAGAGMTHPFMTSVADGFADRGIATLRYQFPFMEHGLRRPDRPAVAHRTVRAAVATAAVLAPSLSLIAGGKSFGGRMTSQAQAEAALSGVLGLAFFGFPLHPPKQPSTVRADHLAAVRVPMLFVQGTRDALADMPLVESVVQGLGPRATLRRVDGADHAFKVPARSGRSAADILDGMLDSVATWAERLVAREDDAVDSME